MIDFNTFQISSLQRELFESVSPSDEELVFLLELYKLIPRESIVEILKSEFPNLTMVRKVHRNSDFISIEQENTVIIDQLNQKELRIIYPVFHEIDLTKLSLSLYKYEIELYQVTKVNFLELADIDIKDFYDSDILFKRILLAAIELNATDLHFTVEHKGNGVLYPVYYRAGGNFNQLDIIPLNQKLNRDIISKFIEKKTNSYSLDLTTSNGVVTSTDKLFKGRKIELRISANAVIDGYRCVIRIQEQTTTSLRISELGFADSVTHELYRLSEKRNGITLITGAIRTGKNTTACAIAHELVNKKLSLIGYDSPIEILMPFPQIDYAENPDNLLNCVRLAKKQDVDIAILNEIPSKEVAFAIKDLVNSSVGVITTIHLNRLWDLPFRLHEYYGDSYKEIISQMNGVVNQKMFGVMCPYCQDKKLVADLEEDYLKDYLLENDIKFVHINAGCESCYNLRTHEIGSVIGKNQPIAEILMFTDEIKQSLLKAATTWEMSDILYKILHERKQNLEFYMLEAIQNGKLSYKNLQYVI